VIRRLLHFLLLFGGGVLLLVFIVSGEEAFQFGGREGRARVEIPEGPGEVKVKTGKREETGPGLGGAVGVRGRGKGDLEVFVEDREARKRRRLYFLSWEDSRPREDGTYDLDGLYAEFHGRGTEREKLRFELRASRANLRMAIDEAGNRSLDRSHEMDLGDVVLLVRAKDSGGRGGATPPIRLHVSRLLVNAGEERFEVHTPDSSQPVRMEAKFEDGPLFLDGKGLSADLHSLGASGGEGGNSWIRIESDVVLRDRKDEMSGDLGSGFELRGGGPLVFRRIDVDEWRLRLEGGIEFRARRFLRDLRLGAKPLDVLGRSLEARIRRGRLPGVDRGAYFVPHALTDLLVEGGEVSPMRLRFGGQSLRARRLAVAIGSDGKPSRLRAEGDPILDLEGAGGEALGRLVGAAFVDWDRESARLPELFGFPKSLTTEVFRRFFFPFGGGEILTIGPGAKFQAAGGAIPDFRSESAVILSLVEGLEGLEPVFGFTSGRVEVEANREPGRPAYRLDGKEGFAFLEPPGSKAVFGSLGPWDREGPIRIRFEEGVLSGRGRILMHGRRAHRGGGPAPGSRLSLHARSGNGMRWSMPTRRGRTSVEGIRDGVLVESKDRLRLELRGRPLRFVVPERGLEARGRLLSRTGDGPWILEGLSVPAVVVLRRPSKDGGEARVRAARFLFEGREGVVGRGVEAWLRAEGRVVAEGFWPGGDSEATLECAELEVLPWIAPPAVEGMLARIWRPLPAGVRKRIVGERLIRARKGVALQFRSRGGATLQSFHGDRLDLWSDGSFLRLSGEDGRVIRGRIAMAETGVLSMRGARLLVRDRGRDALLLGGPSKRPVLFLEGGGGRKLRIDPRGTVRLRLEISGEPSRIASGRLEVPGPFLAREISDPDADFEIRGGGSLVLLLGPAEGMRAPSAWDVPLELRKLLAGGGVEARGDGLGAFAEEIEFEPPTGWLLLHGGRSGGVEFWAGEDLRWENEPGLEVNVGSLEIRGGVGRVRGGKISRRFP